MILTITLLVSLFANMCYASALYKAGYTLVPAIMFCLAFMLFVTILLTMYITPKSRR